MGLIWGTVLSVLGVVGAILIPVTARVVGDDVKEWLPWITQRVVARALSRLPEKERDRFEEEWWAHINELPGNLAKVYAAWGCLSASKAINRIAVSGDTTRIEEVARRAIDLGISVLCLLLVLPLMVMISACIKLDSRGPVFFKQKRLGANNVPFNLLKFRSMYVEHADPLGRVLTRAGDPRITRVGTFLRMTSLDELPQLINVLRGDMSLVGPRPHVLVANAADVYPIRHRVKPGITGWAQVNGWRGEITTLDERIRRTVEHDLYYIENWSLTFDLLILARTVFAVLSRSNVASASVPKGYNLRLFISYVSFLALIGLVGIACLVAAVVHFLGCL